MPEQWQDRRLGWCDLWLRETPGGNPYAHPVSGLKIIVDLNTLEVLDIEDHHDYGRPAVDGEYDPRLRDRRPRTELKPLEISQPDGVSFRLDGHEVHWQNWSLRLGFNFREGLVLHQVGFDDHGTRREIAYRMSFAEMVVPYRDPGFDHYRRTAFDIGEWGLGNMVTSLELGCDCLGEIVYLDAVIADSRGEPEVITQAICLHEEDAGVLWKHVDSDTGAQTRRMRRMVISVPRHGRQLRVPDLLAVLRRRQHRVRGPGHRSDGHHAAGGGERPAGVRHGGGRADVRAVPPALHRRQARPGHRRCVEHRARGRLRGARRSGRTTRTDWR